MPPKTRRANNGPTSTGQSTLSFKNRISKPTDSTSALKNAKSKLNEPAQNIIKSEIARQTTPELSDDAGTQNATGKAKAAEVESPVRILPSPSRQRKVRRARHDDDDDDESPIYEQAEKQAKGISDVQVKKYWKAEEDSRIAPRVHQKDIHIHEKILRHFDLSSQYGPCIGITRLGRWKRAHSMSLNPPIEVLAVLLKEEEKERRKGDKRISGKIAYVDELGGAKDVEVTA